MAQRASDKRKDARALELARHRGRAHYRFDARVQKPCEAFSFFSENWSLMGAMGWNG